MFDQVKEIIVSTINCDADAITMEASLVDDLEMDSLDALDLSSAIEDTLGVTIPDEKLNDMKTVGDVVAIVEESKK